MSVAELKAEARKLTPRDARELSRYVHGLALRKKPARPARAKKVFLAPNDPLLNLGIFAVAGPGGKLSNADIDRTLYGRP